MSTEASRIEVLVVVVVAAAAAVAGAAGEVTVLTFFYQPSILNPRLATLAYTPQLNLQS